MFYFNSGSYVSLDVSGNANITGNVDISGNLYINQPITQLYKTLPPFIYPDQIGFLIKGEVLASNIPTSWQITSTIVLPNVGVYLLTYGFTAVIPSGATVVYGALNDTGETPNGSSKNNPSNVFAYSSNTVNNNNNTSATNTYIYSSYVGYQNIYLWWACNISTPPNSARYFQAVRIA